MDGLQAYRAKILCISDRGFIAADLTLEGLTIRGMTMRLARLTRALEATDGPLVDQVCSAEALIKPGKPDGTGYVPVEVWWMEEGTPRNLTDELLAVGRAAARANKQRSA